MTDGLSQIHYRYLSSRASTPTMPDFLKVFVIGGLWWPKATYQVSYLILKRLVGTLRLNASSFVERHGAPRRRKFLTLYKGNVPRYLTAATWKAQTRLDSREETCNISHGARTIARASHSSLPGYLRGHPRFRLRPNVGLKRSNLCATPSGTMVVSSAAYTKNQSPRR